MDVVVSVVEMRFQLITTNYCFFALNIICLDQYYI